MTRLQHALRDPERGSAISVAVIMMFILAVITAAIGMSSLDSLRLGKARAERTVGLPPADSAITKYQFALRSDDLVSEAEGYVLDRSDMCQLLSPGAGSCANSVVYNSSLPAWVDQYAPGQRIEPEGSGKPYDREMHVTMREQIPNTNNWGFWQIVKVWQPDYTFTQVNPNLVVYFRAWTSSSPTAARATEPRLIRVEFRPGRFADYQLLTDGPIRFGRNARINGPVHSNGFGDSQAGVGGGNFAVSANGGDGVSCTGNQAIITSAQLPISMPGAGCRQDPGNGRFINFLQVEHSFDRMQADAAKYPGDVRVYPARPGSNNRYRVTLQDNRIVVNPGGSMTIGNFKALLFLDDVEVSGRVGNTSGTQGGRVTIAARRRTDISEGAASIRVVGNTTFVGGDRSNVAGDGRLRNSLGLIAQGDVIVSSGGYTGACVGDIHAAMVAESGALTIDPALVTEGVPQNGTPDCSNPIRIWGAVASHRSPIMYWTWPNHGDYAGYTTRAYEYDPNLRFNPPPYFPLTDNWQVLDWQDANLDCLTIKRNDRTCQ